MARVSLDQIELPLRVSGSFITATGDLIVSGSATFLQTDQRYSSVSVSGSFSVENSPNIVTGSYNGVPVDGGSF